MITNKMRKWLEKILKGEVRRKDDTHIYSVYVGRIRDRMDREFENFEWVAENMPEIIRDEEWEINTYGVIKHRRLKKLLKIIELMYPDIYPQMVRNSNDQ